MTHRRDDWDAEEREALDGLEGELASLRRKHQDDPSLALLRAADADALPPELQAQVARHLQDSAWSRAVVAGLRDADADDRLDAAAEDRLLARITRDAQAAAKADAGARRWMPGLALGSLALAATVLIAVLVPLFEDTAVTPAPAPPPVAAAPAPAPILIGFEKPEVKLSAETLRAVIAWRGNPSADPFARDLAPALDAYRAGDSARAGAAFDRLAAEYPSSVEVLFYQGVSHMLAGNEAAAIAPLEAAARLQHPAFADDVSWFLAVARQRAGGDSTAAFAALCKGNGPFAAAACAAVQQLDDARDGRPR